jgi:transposase
LWLTGLSASGKSSLSMALGETDGLEGLTDKNRTGRPTIYDEQDRERLKTLVSEAPHQIKAVQARLQQETGKSSCTTTIKRALKKNWDIASSVLVYH